MVAHGLAFGPGHLLLHRGVALQVLGCQPCLLGIQLRLIEQRHGVVVFGHPEQSGLAGVLGIHGCSQPALVDLPDLLVPCLHGLGITCIQGLLPLLLGELQLAIAAHHVLRVDPLGGLGHVDLRRCRGNGDRGGRWPHLALRRGLVEHQHLVGLMVLGRLGHRQLGFHWGHRLRGLGRHHHAFGSLGQLALDPAGHHVHLGPGGDLGGAFVQQPADVVVGLELQGIEDIGQLRGFEAGLHGCVGVDLAVALPLQGRGIAGGAPQCVLVGPQVAGHLPRQLQLGLRQVAVCRRFQSWKAVLDDAAALILGGRRVPGKVDQVAEAFLGLEELVRLVLVPDRLHLLGAQP